MPVRRVTPDGPDLPPHALALARRLARRAASGARVGPVILAAGSRSRCTWLYAERAGGVRVVAHVAGRSGSREWRAPVEVDGTLGPWQAMRPPVTRVSPVRPPVDPALARPLVSPPA